MSDALRDCERAEHLLPDFWQDQLSGLDCAADLEWLRGHLELCAHCAGASATWRRLANWPEEQPSPQQRERFHAMLDGATANQAPATPPAAARPRRWAWLGLPSTVTAALALGCALALGGAAGWLLRAHSATTPSDAASQIADLRDQVRTTEQLAVLSLLQQQSPSDRLQGVSWSARLSSPDPQVVEALLHSLQYDSSPDVRLAALDALQHAATPGSSAAPAIERGMVAAFRDQQSPLVQVALVDSLVDLRAAGARTLLQQVSHDGAYPAEVRQRAAWGLAQPTWN